MKMQKRVMILTFVVLLFAASIVAGEFFRSLRSSTLPDVTQTTYETRGNNLNSVTIEATPTALSYGKTPTFHVSFNTHSVDLDFDVASIAALIDQGGRPIGQPAWTGSPPGGHHRNGTLTFSIPLPQSVRQVTLIFKDIADIPSRDITWEVKN